MPSFWKVVKNVLNEAEVILLVMDARFPEETLNQEILEKIKWCRKPVIFVLNKSELVTKHFQEITLPKEVNNFVWFSALKHYGVHELRKKILSLTRKRPVIAGVVGYPNTGKSSLINCLSQRHAAPTSARAGFPKGLQKVRVSKDIYLLDTPGVIPYKSKDYETQALIGAFDTAKIKEPDIIAMAILEKFKKAGSRGMETYYKTPVKEDFVETLEDLAKKLNYLKKGGLPDIQRVSRKIIEDWQRGRFLL